MAAGAAIVSLIGHAHDASAPEATVWLLAGAVALGLLALIVIGQSLLDAERLSSVYRPLSIVLGLAQSQHWSLAGRGQLHGSWQCSW